MVSDCVDLDQSDYSEEAALLDLACEAVFLQEVQRPSADFRRIGRGADDSDAARPEQAVERGAGQVYFRLSRKADTASRCESVV